MAYVLLKRPWFREGIYYSIDDAAEKGIPLWEGETLPSGAEIIEVPKSSKPKAPEPVALSQIKSSEVIPSGKK